MEQENVIPPAFLTPRDVCRRLGISIRTLQRWVETNRIPAPIRFTSQTLRWPADQIEAWLVNPFAASPALESPPRRRPLKT